MVLQPTNAMEIAKVLFSLKNKKSTGNDGNSNEMLKCCSPVIECYLANAVNNFIQEKVFPDNLKIAKVLRLHKKAMEKVLVTIDQFVY